MLVLAPILTGLVSISAIIMVFIFRRSEAEIQVLPRTLGRVVAWLSGVSVSLTGSELLEPGVPYIFAANHQSQFDIFALQGYLGFDFRWLLKLELFKDKKASNLLKAIEKSKSRPLSRLIFALGIPNVGEKAARILAGRFLSLENIVKAGIEYIPKNG